VFCHPIKPNKNYPNFQYKGTRVIIPWLLQVFTFNMHYLWVTSGLLKTMPMKILVCPDKFKECLNAGNVATHIRNGILRGHPEADCKIVPLADGGEGTVEAMREATGGRIENVQVHDPLMRSVNAGLGISGDGKTAVIEMAAASGLALLTQEERNPLFTTTYGTGELIRYALDKGCSEIVVGIGGSATVDGGVGMAQALGISFTDDTGWEIAHGGGQLDGLMKIDLSNRDPRIGHCRILVACDVTSPLTGPHGAAHVFGPQKGASPEMVLRLENNLKHLARVVRDELHAEVEKIPGSGAAGGLGAGILAFLGGELKPGFDVISQAVKLEEWIHWADLVITGEGKMDFQTSFGKAPAGVAAMAKKHKKNVIAFTGAICEGMDRFQQIGFDAVIPITDKPMTLEQSMGEAGRLLENTAERVMKLILLGQRM
jgi:glycerate 2-kinase